MNKTIFSCMGCENRYPGCHAVCETYKQEKAELDKSKEEMRKVLAINRGIKSQKFDGIQKAMKKQHSRSPYRKVN